jgi:nitrogen fixation/metabolism regulation signal transduction histidine kinase
MVFLRYRVQLVVRALVLLASALLLAYLVGWTDWFYAPVAVILALVYQVVALVQYAEKAPRDIVYFLEAVRQADFTQRPRTGERGPLFDQLRAGYTEVMAEFERVRTEKEAHAQYLQTVVQHVGVALVSLRADGTVELANTAARRLLGHGQLRHLGDLRTFSPALVETVQRLASGEQAVVRVVEEERELQLAVYATRFSLRGEHYTLVSVQDIRSELEEKEMEAWQKLTRVLTHEIMNSAAPIASLASTAQRLLHRVEALEDAAPGAEAVEDAREALAAIERRSQALMHFTDTYRSFTKVPQPTFQVFPIHTLFTPVQKLLRVQAAEQGIDWQTTIQPADLEFIADPELIEQVLINLLLNAMDALQGRPDPRLGLHARIDRHGQPIIQVIDNGPGIPPDLQERIFIPFFTTRADGSGIGLSLSRVIMRVHGGMLSLRSEPGVQTVFTLSF